MWRGFYGDVSGRETIIFFQSFAAALEFAEGFHFLLPQAGEGVEDVGELTLGEAVEMCDEGINLGAGLGAVAGVAALWGAAMQSAGG